MKINYNNKEIPPSDTPPKSLTKIGHFANGSCSSLIMITCLHPLSTTKTHLMNGKGFPPFSQLYKGITSSAGSVIPIQSISFLTQGALVNYYFNGNREIMTDTQKIAVGLSGGIPTSVIATSFDRVMIQQQLNGWKTLYTVRKIINHCGPQGLMKGYFPALTRESFFSMTLFGTSDVLADKIMKRLPQDWENKETISITAGRVLAGIVAGALTTPVDVLKTRMQADLEGKYPTSWKTISQLVNKEGPKSLIKGIWIRSCFVSLAILILGYAKEKLPNSFPKSLYQ